MYKTDYFAIEELVTPRHLEMFTEKQLWRMLDERILRAIDLLRQDLGPIIINNWKFGGRLDDCGLRLPDFYPEPSPSQHLSGRAMDIHPRDYTPKETRQVILENQIRYRGFISRIEANTDTWVHIDVCNSENEDIIVFGG